MTKNELFEKIRGYLIGGGMKKHSVSSYISYLNDLDKKSVRISKLFDIIASATSTRKQLCTADDILMEIDLLFKSAHNPLKYKKSDYTSAINKLIDLLRGDPCIIKGQSAAKKHGASMLNVLEGPDQDPVYKGDYGSDEDCKYVYYNENVEDTEKIQGLCRKLQTEYLEYIYNFANRTLEQIFGEEFPQPIKVELCKECPSRIYLFNDKYIAMKINEVMESQGRMDAKTYARISRRCMRTYGVFVSDPEPKIKIYYNQFDVQSEYIANIANTIAHEFLHYLEYVHCSRRHKTAFADDRVSEALADFFGLLYSVHRGAPDDLKVARQEYDLWTELDGSGWPYAYALYFYQVNGNTMNFSYDYTDYVMHDSLGKFREVFYSTVNPGYAYEILTET